MNNNSGNVKKPDILVVDDVPENLRLLASILQSRGYRLRRVTNGKMALSAAHSAPPDLILLDIMMPDISGYEVCEKLKSSPDTSEIPVIFLSALDDVVDKIKGFQVGGVDYITKPFQVEEVIARIETQLTIVRQKNILSERNARLQEEILARQNAESALHRNQEFLAAVIDTNPNLIFVKNNEGIYSLVNLALANFYGMKVAEFVGKTDADLKVNKPCLEWLVEEDLEVSEMTEPKIIYKQPLTSITGEVRWFQIIKKPLLSLDGKPDGVLGVATDITERLVAEQNLWLQNEQERLLSSIVKQIRQSLRLEDILHTTVTKVRQFLRTNRVLIYRKHGKELYKVVVEASSNDAIKMLGTSVNQSLLIEMAGCLENCCSLDIRAIEDVNIAGLSGGVKSWLEEWEVQSQLAIPIAFARQSQAEVACSQRKLKFWQENSEVVPSCFLWGLLVAQQCETKRNWQPWEIEFLCALSDQVGIAIEQAELLGQLEAANFELQRLSNLDGLTGLANRRRFDEYLASEWLRQTLNQKALSLILCDVDFFKRYNDSYGHQAGDECLQNIAGAIDAAHKPEGLAARIGGEEFAVILPFELPEALEVAKKIHAHVRGLMIVHPDSSVCEYVTISVGVATTIPQPQGNLTELIEVADRTLYRAKQQGRNQVIAIEFTPDAG
ncbi:diguanylate cyclase [Ancylothrix sp. C2]|uniref:diguanylate cyclase domain-containing protein n=1 Tax=Ancylothrix sp. D3o TaxID=2953691 RepID=UPI0021BAD0F5|nr:diguanylate cyclase [Ancylothrix sp. D3o]MCT7951757.1 diguanylate cyclase [Ancylothrix sp. D3o]